MLAIHDVGFLRRVLEAVPAFVLLVDRDHRIVYINRLQPGFRLEDVVGRHVDEFAAPEFRVRQNEAIDAVFQTGATQSFAMRSTNPDGSTATYESRAVGVDYGDGQRAVCLIALEVTELVAGAEALRRSEERLRLLVDATGLALWSWDARTGRVEWSERMHAITGQPVPLDPPAYLERLVHTDDRAAVGQSMSKPDQPELDAPPHRIVRPDGEVRWVLTFGRPRFGEHGVMDELLGGTLDVTRQRRLEEHVRDAQKTEVVGALTAGVAHNFNNMLAVIVPVLEILRDEVAPSRRALVRDAAHAAQRASELVAQLMTFTGQRRPEQRAVQPPATAVERALSMCERTFPASVRIERRIGAVRPVRCHASSLEQVVVNLLINARDAVLDSARGEGTIRVELSEASVAPPAGGAPGPYARLLVRDDGVGMSAAVKDRAFEPFFTTKGPGRGTGLGLPTSYGIVRDHGGFLLVESAEGAGTSVAVYLPVEQVSASEPIEAPGALARPGRGTVLVVDDEVGLCAVVEQGLETHGYVVVSASDAAGFERVLASELGPDVVLLDRSMPFVTSRVALQRVRERFAGVPVLFFTGQDVPAEDRGLVEEVVHKPVSIADLADAVGRWTSGRPHAERP